MTHRRWPARGPLSPGPSEPEEEMRRRLIGQLAAEQGVTMSELCRAWVEEALAQHFG